jgi:hypothetical protein
MPCGPVLPANFMTKVRCDSHLRYSGTIDTPIVQHYSFNRGIARAGFAAQPVIAAPVHLSHAGCSSLEIDVALPQRTVSGGVAPPETRRPGGTIPELCREPR